MVISRSIVWFFASTILAFSVAVAPDAAAEEQADKPDSEVCLGCHGIEGFSAPALDGDMRRLEVTPERFLQSVHGQRFVCVDCHKDIVEIPHREGIDRKVGCVQCHRSLWDAAQRDGKTKEFARLGDVVQQIERYMGSIHARPNIEDQSRTNATCYDCHNAHYVYPIDSSVGSWSRLEIPDICGRCHQKERDTYLTSVHGQEISLHANTFAAVCIDCHTTHTIESPEVAATKLSITKNCGNCHEDELETYTGTYHGQVTTLGYAHTAKCFECHGSHAIQRVSSPASTVHEDNRLKTCQTCHKDATEGFITFHPHGNSHDFERFPDMWVASKFMIALLGGVFAFFWTHSALWFYREYRDRKEGKNGPHIKVDDVPDSEHKYIRRWSAPWRVAHLLLAVAVMVLVLTGTSVLYADSAWAQFVMQLIGGPKVAGIAHRTAALTFIILFFGHLIYFAIHFARTWRSFRIFGPNSLVPSLQDFKDALAMFKWFFGVAPRPVFDRWAYWEKFDYWAPFWGMAVIGVSGAMLWFPEITASVLPGWVFNVATIVHGEEAFLAAVFLFSVHFFNVNFRPDKFPQDIVMFTGVMPLEEYKREHTLEYKRLLERGELGKYLVDAPSAPMTRGSKFVGMTLIVVGVVLLVLVLSGFVHNLLLEIG